MPPCRFSASGTRPDTPSARSFWLSRPEAPETVAHHVDADHVRRLLDPVDVTLVRPASNAHYATRFRSAMSDIRSSVPGRATLVAELRWLPSTLRAAPRHLGRHL
jgi:hypothetical protein